MGVSTAVKQCAVVLLFTAAGPAGAGLLPANETPLRTQGRYIIGRGGERVKWSCVNWYGAYSETSVVGGAEVRPIRQIVDRIVHLGFNCVRLCYSTQAHLENPLIEAVHIAANPVFFGKRFLDVWDATVDALTDAGLMVIINNQVHKSGWCCHFTQVEGLWYQPDYPESVWIDSLVNMTLRHRSNPLVVAIDLRNEVHDYEDTVLTWGDGNPLTDWAAAATRAGNAVLAANPDVLIVVMALCFGMELRPARAHPIRLDLPDRVVYQTHNYLEYQLWSLISQSFVSWQTVRLVCGFGLILPTMVLLVLWRYWDKAGRPRPSWPVVGVSYGSWLCGISLITAAICKALMVFLSKNPGCGYWARKDVVPTLACAAALAVLGAFAAVVGCVRLRLSPRRHAAAPHRMDGVDSNGIEGHHRGHAGFTAGGNGDGGQRSRSHRDESSEELEEEEESSEELHEAAGLRGCCCQPGCDSLELAWSRVRKRGAAEAEPLAPAEWDCGLCCAMQCCTFCTLLWMSLMALLVFGCSASTYGLLEGHLDRSWGFLLEEGHSYTAPVWLGEFGNSVPGQHWINLMHYLNERDMDFAYWAINGLKYGTGYISLSNGGWVSYDAPRWENETFGVLQADYWTVRYAWRMLDLQALTTSPASWRPRAEPCDRQDLGGACGG